MNDKLQEAINALRAAGNEAGAKAVEELRADMARTMEQYHAGQRASYESGRKDEREAFGASGAWRPIETAPKDGRWIQLFGRHPHGGCNQITARWWAQHADDGGCWECGDDQYQPYLNPTLLQPLPPDPQ
jgi:hypothetical protein